MNTQEKIFRIYNVLSENQKVISELLITPSETNYSTIKFASRTKNDQINKALLDDLDTAAKAAGVTITVDFAKTDHDKYTASGNISRHWKNNAVDIDYIDGKVVSPVNSDVVNKFVDALVSMGYKKNAEGGQNPKSVLTFGFPGHSNHVHVSNSTDNTSQIGPDYDRSDTESSDIQSSGSTIGDVFLDKFIDSILSTTGIKEEKLKKDISKIKKLL